MSVSRGMMLRASSSCSRKGIVLSALIALAGLASLAGPPAAHAGIQGELAAFSDCPLENPAVGFCLISKTTSGEFKLGSKTVPITKPVLLQGGTTKSHKLVPAADGNTLSKTPLPLPGGLLGIVMLGDLTEVTVTAELAGTVEINLTAANEGKGVAASLPLKAKLDNPLLGAACYIGSDSEPFTPELTTGTTSPPPPTEPITGSTGEFEVAAHGKVFRIHHSSLVDNAFAAPGANGCGGLLSLLVDPSVDLVAGLPSAAGNNKAILNGTVEVAEPRSVKAARLLPDLGRCVKAETRKEGGTTRFNGGYNFSDCVEESRNHEGHFEWLPGPGPNAKFTTTSGAVTLETTGKAKLKCAASSGSGEYTGRKSATMGLTLNGCVLSAGSAECHSAGSGAGEIVAGGLQATLGYIKDVNLGPEVEAIVGWDLQHEPSVLTAECGAAKDAIVVTGSVIGTISSSDKMSAGYGLKFSQTAGKQEPEAFEEQANDTLSAKIGGGPAEQAGLKAAPKVTNQEKLEFKAEAE